MNNVSWQKGLTLNVGADMTFTANGTWHGPTGGTRELHVIRIFDGGTFNVNGDWDPNYTHLQVDNGGEFRFNPKSFKSDNNQWKQSWFDVYGTLDAPAGLKATGNLRMDIITHEGSTIQLGGDVSKNGNAGATLRWLVKGGQIKADGDVHLDCAELEIAAGAAVSVVVAENKVFDLYPFTTIGEGAQITKTGRAFMWTNGTWTIAKDATVVTSGYLFEFGPDAPAATYGERRIVVTAANCARRPAVASM